MRVKMSKPPAPTASAIGPCPTVIKIVGRPGTGSWPSTIAPPDIIVTVAIIVLRSCFPYRKQIKTSKEI